MMPSQMRLIVILFWVDVAVSHGSEPLAKGIQDNSFLIEEAYNQEPGVVQHILNIPFAFDSGTRLISPSFTQEWPIFTQQHQFFYTLPYSFAEDQARFDEIRLNYRFQALTESEQNPAFAPRLTLVIPTDDGDFGSGRLGYEINLPFSKIVGDRWTVHFNAGTTIFPNKHGHDLWNYNLGASAIYAVSENLNLMLESLALWEEEADTGTRVDRSVTALISPGARYAFNLPNEAQLVVGLAIPIGLTSDSPEYGLFLYCSYEHFFVRRRQEGVR